MPISNSIFELLGNAFFIPKAFVFASICAFIVLRWATEHIQRKELSQRKRIESFNKALINKKVKTNAYVIEQLFLDRYGFLLSYKEIKYFLRQEKPSYLISKYLSAKNFFLEFDDRCTCLKPVNMLRGKGLYCISLPAFVLFIVFGLLGLLSLISSAAVVLDTRDVKVVVQFISLTIPFLVYSWICFEVYYCADSALKLRKYTKF